MRLLAIGAVVTAYNVNELPASIINKPGVFQPETTSYFGFSLAVREIDGEANVLIGAPSHQDTGALYNCNVYGKCQDFDAGSSYQDNSMFGASVTWLSDESFVSCEPRYTEFYKCFYDTKCRSQSQGQRGIIQPLSC